MRILFLFWITTLWLIVGILQADTNDISNGVLRVKCNVMDSTQTIKDVFQAGEPITYSLTILNVDIYAVPYQSSSVNTSIAIINMIPYTRDKHALQSSPPRLDVKSALEPDRQIFMTSTVFIDKPGKYEFVVTPLFRFKKGILPDIGNLNRIFTVQ